MARRKLTSAQIFHFFEQLRALLGAGITPYAALQIMKQDAGNEKISGLLDALSEQIAQGRRLSEAAASTDAFPDYVNELLVIGEQTGRLENVCGSLARYYEDDDELRNAVRSAVSYPLVMIVMMFAVVIVLLSKVMPVFQQVFEQLGTSANSFTLSLMKISKSLSRCYVAIIIVFAVLVLVFLWFYCTEKGRKQFGSFLETFGPTKKFTEALALTRFAGGLQMTTSAGLDPYTSLDMTARIVGNKAVREKILRCREELQNGASFSEAVAKVGMFDSFYTSMITVFAQAGSVDKAMEFIAKHYKDETDRRISRLLSSIEPTMVAVLSVVVGLILLSVILPLMGVMSNIGW